MINSRWVFHTVTALAAGGTLVFTQPGRADPAEVDAVYPKAYALYLDLHQHPELSLSEVQT